MPRLEVPRAFKPLLYPRRYKGLYGGRGGAKSHFLSEQVLIACYASVKRVVCIREIQDSIRDSVRQLLVDKIAKLELGAFFHVLDSEIRGSNGSLIIFKGMRSYNAETIKSLEAYDIAWVEEAQTLSQRSLDMLRPTIRKPGSELWFSWNPRYKTDPVDRFFRGDPPEDSVSVFVNFRDNPWFPEVLRRDMMRDFKVDADKAESVWNGSYGSSEGDILARWVNAAEREGRINDDVAFDPAGAPVEVSSDIGFRDTASWWFWQRKPGGFNLLAYDGDSGLDAEDWVERLEDKRRALGLGPFGRIWLPVDARAKTFQSKHSSVEKFIRAFGAAIIRIVPPSKKQDQINAARSVLPRCTFNRTACGAGLDGLRGWKFEWIDDANIFSREPVHDGHSHPADAYAYGCQVMSEHVAPAEETWKPPDAAAARFTLDGLYEGREDRQERYG